MSLRSGRAFIAAAAAIAIAAATLGYFRRSSGAATVPQASAPQEWFVDRAVDTGLDFVHFNGMSGAMFYAELMAPGVALLDYDNDGDLDVFIVQGRMLGGRSLDQATRAPKGALKGHLYRNDLQVSASGARTVRFTDVTEASHIEANEYGMGVATGDFDNDGCVDLYVTAFGRNQLFRNNCDATFADVSQSSGTGESGWSISAAFVDYDRDGWLDLFVGHYVNYSTATNIQCHNAAGSLDFCPPNVYSAQPSHLFHNNQDGTFTDVTAAAGLSHEFGPALGVVTADFNGDGWIDLYVGNDGQPNQLWINRRDGRFENNGLLSGTALSAEGVAKSSMGVDAGDLDNDGDEDLFITELTGQGSDLYVNDGRGLFADDSARSQLRFSSLPYTGFGSAWLDFDNDGWLDILTVNGAVASIEKLVSLGDSFPLGQGKQLFRNRRDGRFDDVTAEAGAVFRRTMVGRGAAFGDIDNDGDIDVLVGNDAGPAELLMNEIGSRNHWIGLRLVAADGSRDMLGARVGVVRADGSTLWRRVHADGSYASANNPRVLVGLGAAAGVARIRVRWPDGRGEEFSGLPIERYTTVRQGSGTVSTAGGSATW